MPGYFCLLIWELSLRDGQQCPLCCSHVGLYFGDCLVHGIAWHIMVWEGMSMGWMDFQTCSFQVLKKCGGAFLSKALHPCPCPWVGPP